MPHIIRPDTLHNPSRPPIEEMREAILNTASTYFTTWKKFPKYLYVNADLWNNDIGEHLHQIVADMKMNVVTVRGLPPDRISLHSDYIPKETIESWHRSVDNEDGLDQGKLNYQ